MSFPLPRVNQQPAPEASGLFNVAKSYSPTTDDLLLLGNTIVSSSKRTKSPASYSGSPNQLNSLISSPNLSGSPNMYTPRQGFDQNGMPLQASPGLLGYPGSRQGYGGSRGQDLLGGMGGMNSRGSLSLGNSMSPYHNADYIPQGMNPMSLNSGFPDYLRGPMNRLENDPNVDDMNPAVHNYFNKQNEIMAKILKDVQEFKKLEQVKERMMYDQQFSRMDLSGNGMLSPYGQNLTSLNSFPAFIPMQPMQMGQLPMIAIDPSRQIQHSPSLRTPPNQNPYEPGGPPIGAPSRRDVSFDSEGNNPSPPKKNDMRADSIKSSPKKKPTLMKKANKIRGRRNLKAIAWTMALPGLWFISTVKWAEKRRAQELKALEELIPEHLEKFLEFGAEVIEKEIKALALDKNSMIIVLPPKTSVKPAELDKRCKTITDHLITILDSLSLKLDSGKLPKEFFQFLATLSENDATIPENFLSGFEIDRLSFNMLGNLKSMNDARSKMILGSFVLVKGLLYFLIMRSWTVISSIPEKNVNMKNMINVGSVLYNIILEVFFETVPEIQEPESEPPFKALKTTFVAVDPGVMNKLDVIPEDNDNDDIHIIAGFYERDRLMAFLDDRPLMMKEVKEAVIDFLDVLYEITHSLYQPKAHVKKMFKDHRPR